MSRVPVRFVISELSEFDMDDLKQGHMISSKMFLTPDDYALFKYGTGDMIEIESENGGRDWCEIHDLEKIETADGVILLFTLRATVKVER